MRCLWIFQDTHQYEKSQKEIILGNMAQCIKYLEPKCEDQRLDSTLHMNGGRWDGVAA